MPTGVALRDAEAELFAAAERVVLRDGAGGLTSRAVTGEAGVAKGVLHRHFADFDGFLVGLVRDRITRLEADLDELRGAAGSATLSSNLTESLIDIVAPVNLALAGMTITRDELRTRLRATTPRGIPILAEATRGLTGYLEAERDIGRIRPDADVRTVALSLVGTGHLMFAEALVRRDLPDATTARKIVEAVIAGVQSSSAT